jgi:hypothetical protein
MTDTAAPTDETTHVVTVGPPGNTKRVVLNPERETPYTVGEVMTMAGFNVEGFAMRLLGEPVALTAPIKAGMAVFLVKNVAGA